IDDLLSPPVFDLGNETCESIHSGYSRCSPLKRVARSARERPKWRSLPRSDRGKRERRSRIPATIRGPALPLRPARVRARRAGRENREQGGDVVLPRMQASPVGACGSDQTTLKLNYSAAQSHDRFCGKNGSI